VQLQRRNVAAITARYPHSMRRSRATLCLSGCLLATACAPAVADTQRDSTEEILEATRERVRATAEWLARGVDSWFGDKPYGDVGRVRNGRVLFGVLKRQNESADYTLRFNARFTLPNVEERAFVFIGRDNRQEILNDQPEALSRQQQLQTVDRDERSFFAGVGLALRDDIDFRVGFRSGVKPYAQARYRRYWQPSADDRIDFRQTLFWSLDDRFGASTAASYEHALSRTLAARWLGAATISQKTRHVEWSTSGGLYKLYGMQRQLAAEVLVGGTGGTGVDVADYGVQTRWQQPVHEDWLIGEVLVGHFWPRKDYTVQRQGAWAMGASLRLLF
jgi:uncharacterized protein YhjY with autotransporter beta-barrel domain